MTRSPIALGAAAYGLWGAFPLYIHAIRDAGPLEMVAHRVVWSFVVCGAWILLLRRGSALRDAALDRRMAGLLVCSALLIGANWSLFLWGAASGHVVDVSLGYFINPLVSVALGVVVLHERPGRIQVVALAFSLAAVAVLTAHAHHLPYLSLGLAGTFAGYGFVKKSVTTAPLVGMTLESAVLAPVALVVLWHLHAQHELTLFHTTPLQQALLVGLGAATAIPLMLFAAAASSLTLTEMGLLQYLTPIGQFLIGTLALSEDVDPTRWVAVAMIWVAVILIVADSVVRRRDRLAPVAA